MLSCEQFCLQLSAWLDDELPATDWEALQRHMAACTACSSVAASSRQVLAWSRDSRLFAMPPEASQRLHRFLDHNLAPLPAAAQPEPPRRSVWRRLPGWQGRLWSYRPAWAALAIVALLAIGVVRWNAGAATVSGWLIDRHCFTAYQHRAADHPRDCLIRCASHGYGLVDAQGHFLPFNAKGNKSARVALESTHKLNHLWVTVLATQTSDHVLDVERLALTTPPATPSN